MDQRPGQNVDLGLYFHREGTVSLKNNAKKSIVDRQFRKIEICMEHVWGLGRRGAGLKSPQRNIP